MSDKRIEIIAIGVEKIYSVASIEISQDGDVYLIERIKGGDYHLSRHASGQVHIRTSNLTENLWKGKPIKDFKGIECLGTSGFSLDSLPVLYKEYRLQRSDGVFCIDLRTYKGEAFNMCTHILTEDSLPTLLGSSNPLEKRQLYLYPDSTPMIAVTVGRVKSEIAKHTIPSRI